MRALIVLVVVALCERSHAQLLLAQAVVRHGDKVPDAIDPLTADFWEQFGIAGQLTPLGIEQMRNLGRDFNTEYVATEPILPENFDQNLLQARATSLGTARTLVSAEAMMEGLYPGAPVPIYTVEPSEEFLLRPDQQCASYVVEMPRIKDEISAEFREDSPDVIAALRNITGYPPDMTEWDLIWNVREKLEAEEHHGYPLDPYLVANTQLIEDMGEHAGYELYRTRDDDVRGPIGQTLARELAANIRAVQDGSSQITFHLYSAHGGTLQTLWTGLGLGSSPELIGAALIIEYRLLGGDPFVTARWTFPGPDGVEYVSQAQPLLCPELATVCPLADFLATIDSLNANLDGCCSLELGFFQLGCADYLNPAVLDIPECELYRRRCPHVACGAGQVVDAATLLCVNVQ